METASSYPPNAGWLGTSSGKTSISFTTQSLSVPLVEANRFGDRRAADAYRLGKHRRYIGQHVGAAVNRHADRSPASASSVHVGEADRPRHIGNWLGRIGDVWS